MAEFEVIVTGGKFVDGTGNPWAYADLAIANGDIAAVAPPGAFDASAASERVDAAGLVVCPGFIDIQSHSIGPFLSDRRSLSKVTQGVTTEIMGEAWTPAPFGGRITSPFPDAWAFIDPAEARAWDERARGWSRFGDWLADLEGRGVSVNVGSFLGHGTLREYAKGYAEGEATPDEVATMRRVMAEAMEDGAFGLATALIYPPSCFATTAELVALMEVVAEGRGVHITHLRSEEARILEALAETLEIARRTGVSTEIYHLKAAGAGNWRLMPEVIARIDAARAAGIDVTCDMYPYVAAGTGLATVLPPWASADGKLWENVHEPESRARIKAEILKPTDAWENLGVGDGPENVVLAGLLLPEHAGYVGRSLAAVAAERGQHWADTAMDLLAAERQNVFCFYFEMSDDNLRLQMRQPWMKFATDAGGVDPAALAGRGLLHPRAFGTYPRVLGHYVRDEAVIPLEDAIRKMTSSVADRLGLRDRGLLRSGMAADIVVFDPATIADRATYSEPHQLSVGVRDVWVNGQRVVRDGEHTGALPGRWLRGAGIRS
ncbi:MAG: D-aminoacylase [Chloroflexia bacterium]|nr:D-aminoacylase [Chloroflexia bacterium]